jgi:hypothetical protein
MWADTRWACRCIGRLHDEHQWTCSGCDLKRPQPRWWSRHVLLYGTAFVEEHRQRAVQYMASATFCIVVREGLEAWNEAYPHLLRQVAKDFELDVAVLEAAWTQRPGQ